MPASAARRAFSPALAACATAGELLRVARIRNRLTMRQVVIATKRIALQLDNDEFAISLGHLSEIERLDIAPNIYRLYSLATIYELDLLHLLAWFGIPVAVSSSSESSTVATASAVFDLSNKG
jgi:transcriptional regulator with XRE-family HTH domain